MLLLYWLTTCVMTIMMARMIMMDIRTLLHNILIKQMSHLICEWLLWLTATGIIYAIETPWSIARYLHYTSIKRKDVLHVHASDISRINQWISKINLNLKLPKSFVVQEKIKDTQNKLIRLKNWLKNWIIKFDTVGWYMNMETLYHLPLARQISNNWILFFLAKWV